jgi:IPT/TIG domain
MRSAGTWGLGRSVAAGLTCSVLATVGFAAQARAATYTVGDTIDAGGTCAPDSDKCSLRQLIDVENGLASTPSQPDTIVLPAGTYELTNGPLIIDQSLTIAGAGARTTRIEQKTTSSTSRVFDIQPNAQLGVTPTVVISGVTMAYGKADSTNGSFGGDVRNQANLLLSEDLIENGTTTSGSGGGISNDGGQLILTHSLVWNNRSTNPDGGGIAGGLENYGDDSVGAATALVVDSTIAHNTSDVGGGIVSRCNGEGGECSTTGATNAITILNSTIAANHGGSNSRAGGGLLASHGSISVGNSIVASNTVSDPQTPGQTASNCGTSGPGTIASLGDNLETAADCGFTSPGDLQNTDPRFLTGRLAFNGGNTETFALSATSPAVDAVPSSTWDCYSSDQRDVARPQGTGCDIGAYELFQPLEGQEFTTVVGQVCGSSATIDWGDGTTPSEGTVDSLGQVTGTHTYAEEGIYHATIHWTNSDGADEQTPFDVKVLDAPLTATPSAIHADAGVAFTGPVATFTDADPVGTVSDYSATISWGDGTRSIGSIAANPGGGFEVDGTHTYATAGAYPATVTISDAGGAATDASGIASVNVPPPTVTSVSPAAGPTGGGTSVTISGANFTGVTAVDFGTTPATDFAMDNDGQITATAPSGAGTVDVTVQTAGGTSATSTADGYTYQAPPSASITMPSDDQTYNLNRVVATVFRCTDGNGGPGIQTCTDSGGATGGAGTLDTSTSGPHTYIVTATSKDGQSATATIHYTVATAAPPTVTGGAPTSETSNGAALLGAVNPEGTPTQAFFQYGIDLSERGPGSSTTLYDQSTPPQPIGSDATDHTVTAPLTGLIPGALYHVRLVAINGAGTTYGPDQTFTTAAAPAPPPPVLGQSEDVTRVSGIVFIRTASGKFIPLTGAAQIRTGSAIDALHGSLKILASVGKGKTEHGMFGGGLFRLLQARTGLTTLRLLEGLFAGGPSYALCHAHTAVDATAAALSSHTLQLLRASAHGKFTTRGRYGSATVRGTIWSVADRCDGTLIRDVTDSVAVTDFVRHKTVILHAGQSYLAKPIHPA